MASDDSDKEDLEARIEKELEDLGVEVEDFDLESSDAEYKEVEKIVGVDPARAALRRSDRKWLLRMRLV